MSRLGVKIKFMHIAGKIFGAKGEQRIPVKIAILEK
jgi:hypothetical protein